MPVQCNGGRRSTPSLQPVSAPLLYFEVDPPRALSDAVLAFWGFDVREGAPPTHTLWPDAGVSITWGMYRESTIVLGAMGARTEPMTVPVQPGVAFRGVRFWPDAASALCGGDPRGSRNGRMPLEALGAPGALLSRAIRQAPSLSTAFTIFEEALGSSLADWRPDPVVRQALLLLESAPDRPILALARELGVSDRQLRRRFGDATGLSPKEYARIRRLRQTLGRVLSDDAPPWSTIAAHSGFADQPHLVNEIVRMTAYTPTLLEQRLKLIEHIGVKP